MIWLNRDSIPFTVCVNKKKGGTTRLWPVQDLTTNEDWLFLKLLKNTEVYQECLPGKSPPAFYL